MLLPGKRLKAIYEMVKGGTVADIGTDHALLPVALVESGRCESGFACDIGEGPLQSATKTVVAAGLDDKIPRVLYDGIPPQCRACDTVVIAGMGGLLISDILARCPVSEHTQLLLQPMTKASSLRRWLTENGYGIKREVYVKEGKMRYVILDAHRGNTEPYTQAEIEVGKFTDCAVGKEYVAHRLTMLRLRRDSESAAGRQVDELDALIKELEKLV